MLAAVRGRGDDVARAMEARSGRPGVEGRALSLPVDAAGATWETTARDLTPARSRQYDGPKVYS